MVVALHGGRIVNPAARELLAASTVTLHVGPYVLGSWPLAMESAVHAGVIRSGRRISLVMRDEHEVTALVEERAIGDMPPARRTERGWAVLTLDSPMAWNVVGVLAALTSALAEAGVPLGAVSAFSRDHLLVQQPHLATASAVLGKLCAGVTERGA